MIQDAVPVSIRRGLSFKKEYAKSLGTHLFHPNRGIRLTVGDDPGLQRFWKESTNGQADGRCLNGMGAQNMKRIGMVAVNDLIDFAFEVSSGHQKISSSGSERIGRTSANARLTSHSL